MVKRFPLSLFLIKNTDDFLIILSIIVDIGTRMFPTYFCLLSCESSFHFAIYSTKVVFLKVLFSSLFPLSSPPASPLKDSLCDQFFPPQKEKEIDLICPNGRGRRKKREGGRGGRGGGCRRKRRRRKEERN